MSSLRPEMNYSLSHRIISNSQNNHKNACQDVKPKEFKPPSGLLNEGGGGGGGGFILNYEPLLISTVPRDRF